MSFRRSKALLREVLGDSKYERFVVGDLVTVESPTSIYGLKRSAKWTVSVKREGKPKGETKEETKETLVEHELGIALDPAEGNEERIRVWFGDRGYNPYRDMMIRGRLDSISPFRRNNSGILKSKRSEFFDSVAALVMGAKLDKINFACGNLGVQLPHNVPPKDASVVTFISRGFGRVFRWMIDIPDAIEGYCYDLINRDKVGLIAQGGLSWSIATLIISLSALVTDKPISQLLIRLGILTLIHLIFGGIISYYRWKNQWMEVIE